MVENWDGRVMIYKTVKGKSKLIHSQKAASTGLEFYDDYDPIDEIQ